MPDSLLFNALSEVQSMHRHVRSKHSTPKEGRQQESSQRRCVSPTEEKLGRICLVHLPGLLMRTKGNKLLGPWKTQHNACFLHSLIIGDAG